MEYVSSEKVNQIISAYPDQVYKRLTELKELILSVAEKTPEVKKLVETTKWGEPSYMTKTGSTVRMDWKPRNPDKYYLFFTCSTSLVSTFRLLFSDTLSFEGDRAIIMDLDKSLPTTEVGKCIELALIYHKVKDLPMLGA